VAAKVEELVGRAEVEVVLCIVDCDWRCSVSVVLGVATEGAGMDMRGLVSEVVAWELGVRERLDVEGCNVKLDVLAPGDVLSVMSESALLSPGI